MAEVHGRSAVARRYAACSTICDISTHTRTHIYVYMPVSVCVYACTCVSLCFHVF